MLNVIKEVKMSVVNFNNHNRKHKTNMERTWESLVASADIVGANLRKNPEDARTQDQCRAEWRIKNGLYPISEYPTERYRSGKMQEWINIHTRKTSGTALKNWSQEEKEVIKKFIEAIDDVGTLAFS